MYKGGIKLTNITVQSSPGPGAEPHLPDPPVLAEGLADVPVHQLIPGAALEAEAHTASAVPNTWNKGGNRFGDMRSGLIPVYLRRCLLLLLAALGMEFVKEENLSLGDKPLEVFESILDLELTPGLDMLLGSELEVASVLPDNRV